jgi:hypothetical protein
MWQILLTEYFRSPQTGKKKVVIKSLIGITAFVGIEFTKYQNLYVRGVAVLIHHVRVIQTQYTNRCVHPNTKEYRSNKPWY